MKNITVETRREIAKAIRNNREALTECYKATRDGEPTDTITALVERIGYTAALETVAELVNGVDAFDGRIYEYVREWAASIETAATGEELENLGIYNPSDIHPAHINQLGQAMRTYTPEEPAKPAGESKGTMTTYEIKPGTVPNAIEIYFNEKPDTATRGILKGYRMRWNGQKLCWYGFVTADEITAAMENGTKKETTPKANKEAYAVNPEEFNTVVSDGYMGAYETTGSKYKRGYLFGAELSKAIREDLKKCGFKGVSVSCKTFSGGQEIRLKVKANASDIISEAEYINNFDINRLSYWIKDLDNNEMQTAELWGRPVEEITKIKNHNAQIYYKYAIDNLNGYGIDIYNYREDPIFTKAFNKKLEALQKVLDAYNHDDSNSMVDYFDRHFYETITVYAA